MVGRIVVRRITIDVVDYSSKDDTTRAGALNTEWISPQHGLAYSPPRGTVRCQRALRLTSTRTVGAVPLPLVLFVLSAVAGHINTATTARMPADRTWTSRHQRDTDQAARSAAPTPR